VYRITPRGRHLQPVEVALAALKTENDVDDEFSTRQYWFQRVVHHRRSVRLVGDQTGGAGK
jgi:hypothetical protein